MTLCRKRAEQLAEEVAAAERELSSLQVCTATSSCMLHALIVVWVSCGLNLYKRLFCVKAASLTLDKLEESYWHEFNDFQLQLRVHVDERDTTLSKACFWLPNPAQIAPLSNAQSCRQQRGDIQS